MLAPLLLAAVLGPLYSSDPPAPTSQTFVFLRMRRYWAPCGPGVAQVTRDGNTFDVVFPPFSGGGCAGVVSRLDRRVPLGVLDPGEYTVVSHLPGLSPEVARL